tara:strand:- start:77 stop:379 length:303 start_codon:yes stop_codon:yes gene_type:complete
MRKIAADRNYEIIKQAEGLVWHQSIRPTVNAIMDGLKNANADLVKGDPTGMAKKTFEAVYNAIGVEYRQAESQSKIEKAREYRQEVKRPLAQQHRQTSNR